jgi:hypothetical protein
MHQNQEQTPINPQKRGTKHRNAARQNGGGDERSKAKERAESCTTGVGWFDIACVRVLKRRL